MSEVWHLNGEVQHDCSDNQGQSHFRIGESVLVGRSAHTRKCVVSSVEEDFFNVVVIGVQCT
eukprot:484696-Amphidinium_carterae.2